MELVESDDGTTEHQLRNDEQRDGEVDDPYAVEQHGYNQSEQVGATRHCKEREPIREEMPGKSQDGM